jgi:flagellar motor switch/type III secretory pathway protein FliN
MPDSVPHNIDEGMAVLPPYTRSLLRIQVPVRVTLAESKLPLAKIVELAPGSIIQFKKSCDDPLTLSVGEHEIAVGDAVKVGEKFGLRLASMVMPEEKFRALGEARKQN